VSELKEMYIRVVGRRANYGEIEVLVAVFDLISGVYFRRDRCDMLHARRQCQRIVGSQSLAIARNTATEPRRRLNRKNISAKRNHLLVDLTLRPRTQRDHRDYGTDADDDAEHRQQRPEQVATDRRKRDADCLPDQHAVSRFPAHRPHGD
jgi:hypothetical protein